MNPNRLGLRMARRALKSECGVYRDPDTTTNAPHANRDNFGFPVQSNAPSPATQTGKRLAATYKVEVAQTNAEESRVGQQTNTAGKAEVFAPWVVSFWGDGSADWPAVDVRNGDELRVAGMVLSVVDNGGTGTHGIFRLVRCQKVN